MLDKIKGLFLVVLASFSLFPASGAGKTISVLTCGAGEQLYSVFGHSALMVTDDLTGESDIYNFGMFDFETPYFYFKFIRGNLDYYLDTESRKWFMYYYTEEGRSVKAQRLNLTDEQTDNILSALDTLMLPENRAYKYRFVKDNCTTALRDLVLDNVVYDKSVMGESTGITYREYINDRLRYNPWTKLGVNLIMGSHADRVADFYGSMFLPDIFMNGLARITTPQGMLAAPAEKLNDIPESETEKSTSNYYIIYAIFGILAVFASLNKRRCPAIVYFWITGLLGCILMFISSVSLHEELTRNFNMLWCNPLFIVLAVAASMPRRLGKKRFLLFVVFSGIILCCMFAMIIVWAIGVQAVEPIFAILTLTSLLFILRAAHILAVEAGLKW